MLCSFLKKQTVKFLLYGKEKNREEEVGPR